MDKIIALCQKELYGRAHVHLSCAWCNTKQSHLIEIATDKAEATCKNRCIDGKEIDVSYRDFRAKLTSFTSDLVDWNVNNTKFICLCQSTCGSLLSKHTQQTCTGMHLWITARPGLWAQEQAVDAFLSIYRNINEICEGSVMYKYLPISVPCKVSLHFMI